MLQLAIHDSTAPSIEEGTQELLSLTTDLNALMLNYFPLLEPIQSSIFKYLCLKVLLLVEYLTHLCHINLILLIVLVLSLHITIHHPIQ